MPPVIPWYITLIVIATSLTIAVAAWKILSLSASQSGVPLSAQRRVSLGSAAVLGVWLGAAVLVAPKLGSLFARQGLRVPPVVFFAATAVVVVSTAIAVSSNFRRVLAAAPVPIVVGVQLYRVVGAVFLILLSQGRLPAHFALPAGWGDVAIGLAAPLVALALARRARGSRTVAVSWNVLGLLDLVVAVGMGTGLLAPYLAPGLGRVAPAAALRLFPMVLVPAFAVPVSVLLHVLALSRLLRPVRLESGVMATAAR